MYSGNESNFTWTVPLNGTYYLKAYTNDNRSYTNLINSSVTNFTVDQILPNVNITYPTIGQVIDTATTSLTFNSNERYMSSCNYSLYYDAPFFGYYSSSSATCNGTTAILLPDYDLGYILYASVIDLAGNINTSNVTFTRLLATTTSPGGGGSTLIPNITEALELPG